VKNVLKLLIKLNHIIFNLLYLIKCKQIKARGEESLNTFKRLWLIGIIALIIVLGLGLIGNIISTNTTGIASTKIQKTKDIISTLEKAGYTIKPIQDTGEGLLTGDLTTINIDGDTIGVYEYKNNQE